MRRPKAPSSGRGPAASARRPPRGRGALPPRGCRPPVARRRPKRMRARPHALDELGVRRERRRVGHAPRVGGRRSSAGCGSGSGAPGAARRRWRSCSRWRISPVLRSPPWAPWSRPPLSPLPRRPEANLERRVRGIAFFSRLPAGSSLRVPHSLCARKGSIYPPKDRPSCVHFVRRVRTESCGLRPARCRPRGSLTSHCLSRFLEKSVRRKVRGNALFRVRLPSGRRCAGSSTMRRAIDVSPIPGGRRSLPCRSRSSNRSAISPWRCRRASSGTPGRVTSASTSSGATRTRALRQRRAGAHGSRPSVEDGFLRATPSRTSAPSSTTSSSSARTPRRAASGTTTTSR